jgi:hypothetical protein
VTITTERANPLRQWNAGWGGCSTARRPAGAANKLFLRRSVFGKRFTHEMTLLGGPAVRRGRPGAIQPTEPRSRAQPGRATANHHRIKPLVIAQVTRSLEYSSGTRMLGRASAQDEGFLASVRPAPGRRLGCAAPAADERHCRSALAEELQAYVRRPGESSSRSLCVSWRAT